MKNRRLPISKAFAVPYHTVPLARFFLLMALIAPQLQGCSLTKLPGDQESCKIHTYIDAVLPEYLSTQYGTQKIVRMAIMPFDVPETFAPAGNESVHYGRELARKFQAEFARVGKVSIVELFNRDRWPGKRAEFFVDNAGAIEIARNAGYDLVMVGYVENLVDDHTINLHTKIIDTANRVTIWYGRSSATSHARETRHTMAVLRVGLDKPAEFDFPVRSELLSQCTVAAIAPEDDLH